MTVGDITIREKGLKTSGGSFADEVSRSMIAIAQMTGDAVVLIGSSYLALCFAIFLQHHDPKYIAYYCYFYATLVSTLVMVFACARSDVYDVFNIVNAGGVLKATVKCLIETVFLLIACFFILKISDDFSRTWLVTWSATSAVVLCGFRMITGLAVRKLLQSGKLTKNIAIVGASRIGHQLAAKLAQEGFGTRLVGLFDERRSRLAKTDFGAAAVQPLPALDALLCKGCVDEVVIAIPPHASDRILSLSRRFHPFAVSLRVLAPAGYERFKVLDSCRYGEIGTFRVMGKPLDEVAIVIKRLEDIVIALFCLLLALPLMLFITIAIKLDSPGPVLFKQKRPGANNLPFDLLKFRSMYVEQTDPLGVRLTRAQDPRITRVGRFLRRTSLDELPQLINVLRGDMSLVGPRPHPLAANAAGVLYARAISDYPIRHRVKPGITGWAQVNGWRGETETIEQIRRRVEHDLYYIENWSFTFDLMILGRTVFTVLSRENAV